MGCRKWEARCIAILPCFMLKTAGPSLKVCELYILLPLSSLMRHLFLNFTKLHSIKCPCLIDWLMAQGLLFIAQRLSSRSKLYQPWSEFPIATLRITQHGLRTPQLCGPKLLP